MLITHGDGRMFNAYRCAMCNVHFRFQDTTKMCCSVDQHTMCGLVLEHSLCAVWTRDVLPNCTFGSMFKMILQDQSKMCTSVEEHHTKKVHMFQSHINKHWTYDHHHGLSALSRSMPYIIMIFPFIMQARYYYVVTTVVSTLVWNNMVLRLSGNN